MKIHHAFPYQKLCEDAMIKLGYDVDEFQTFREDLNINKYMVPAFREFTKEDVKLDAIFELSFGEVDEVQVEEVL